MIDKEKDKITSLYDDLTGKQLSRGKIIHDDGKETIPEKVRLPDGTIDRPITKCR